MVDDRDDVNSAGVLGSLEHATMQVLWDLGSAKVGNVLGRINAGRQVPDELAYTTVMTVLTRLTTKGIVDREKVGRGYVYTPRFSERGLMAHMSGQEVAMLLDRYGTAALVQFAVALEDVDPDLVGRLAELASGHDDE